MAWQDLFPLPGARIDAEEERELRLVAQARGGADWALSALIARYQPTVARYLSRLTGSVEQSRVMAERIFTRMDQRIHGPQGGKQLRLWLLRTSTEMGLEMLREPHSRTLRALSGPQGPVGLLPGKTVTGPLRRHWGGLGDMTSKTSRQVRKLIWSATDERAEGVDSPAARANAFHPQDSGRPANDDPFPDLDPREALRFKMIRAVLAELPYGDAQCLALHLVAGLNQAEVARALGITGSAARKRVVHGLQLFALRYEAAAASLRFPAETSDGRASRVFTSPTLAPDFAEPPNRLSNGAVHHSDMGEPASPPAPAIPDGAARVVSANPEEYIEDETAALMDSIGAYDLADEATVVIDPVVVEADSTLPAPMPITGELALESVDATEAELWFASDLLAIPEPHIAIGSIPLGDTPLALEIVDDPRDPPPVVEARETPTGSFEDSAIREDTTPTFVTPHDDALDGVVDDATDDIIMVDLAAMTHTSLSNSNEVEGQSGDDTGEQAVDTRVSALDHAAERDGEVAGQDDLVSIAEIHDPEIVSISGADHSRPAASSVARAGEGEAATTVALGHEAPEPPMVDTVSTVRDDAHSRKPRFVPVLTASETTDAPLPERPRPRFVPVLTAEAPDSIEGAVSTTGSEERVRIEQPSLR